MVVVLDLWTALLFVRAWHARRRAPAPPADAAERFTWVFLVPALNEEVTIRDSVERLLAVPVSSRRIVVIDDGSDDRTAAILDELSHPDLVVVRRELPRARQGKAAALNHAFRQVATALRHADPAEVILVVVDADGRLDPAAPSFAAAHFADAAVGGVQMLVRIYNRQRPLTWCQDVEFSVYGQLFQAGRNDWGTAGMGGNGQFNRLSALLGIADSAGPWRDRLTEDQDLGLRLIARGWEGRQELRAVVAQQGPSSLRALFRQRARWAQGNLQALGLARELGRAPLPLVARLELLLYLFMPLWQGVVGAAFVAAVALAALGAAPFWDGGPSWQLLLFYLLAFGGTILGCIAAQRSAARRSWLVGVLVGHVYMLYTWLLWPVLLRATARALRKRGEWAKTEREPLEQDAATPRSAV